MFFSPSCQTKSKKHFFIQNENNEAKNLVLHLGQTICRLSKP
jgi:hypothetical protein